ncbi:hypothetical protein DdX_01833 [Ditylenchus destructor]|uniref:Uncharacterized protein n=1 Tax=Ditylenchus destructor TaxID=166010 RepID=A0AAD4NIT7_9BILA|nr:hypothetical protein DdX_01833 [Ditylenchus destructor]
MLSLIVVVFLAFSLLDFSHALRLPPSEFLESELVTSKLEGKVGNLLNKVRKNNAAIAKAKKNNDEVLRLTEDLLTETRLAEVSELTNKLKEEYGIRGHVTNVKLYLEADKEKIVVKALDYFLPKLGSVGQAFYQEIPPFSAVEASSNSSAKVVTNELFDSKQSVKSILEKHNAQSLQRFRGDARLPYARHEQLINRLDALAKRYADGLGKNVQLIPLVHLEHATLEERHYDDFLVALAEVNPINLGSVSVNLFSPSVLASLAIHLQDFEVHLN